MLKCTYDIPDLPLDQEIETKPVLKACLTATRALSSLRREAARVPNPAILIDTLTLQEAQASSEIESYVTTQDELFRIDPRKIQALSPNQKEVARYRASLSVGHQGLVTSDGLLTANTIIAIFKELKQVDGSFRSGPGTVLKNETTQDVVYVPPQSTVDIERHMSALEKFINTPALSDWDPLIKMAVIHHQFESIHPFPDGNGRIGRILNVLYLVQQGLLDIPILYLSRYITQSKSDYYRLLQQVRDTETWEEWLLYMINGVTATADETTKLLQGINALLIEYKQNLRREHAKIYSHDLLNTLFRHPYTKLDYVISETGVGRQTAARHLDALARSGLVDKIKIGRENYYINTRLVDLFSNRPDMVVQSQG